MRNPARDCCKSGRVPLPVFVEDLFGEEEEKEDPPASTERPHTDSEPPTLEPDDPEPPPPVVEVPLPTAAEKPVTASVPSGGDLFDEEGEEEPKQKPVTQV